MLRLRIIHHLRTVGFLLVLFLILGSVGLLTWANYTGMPKSWRQAVERGVAKHGIHVEIGSLSYHPLQGIVARQVKVYASSEREQVISRLEGVILDLDNAKLAKGELQLARVKLSKAKLILPVDPEDPNSERLEIDNVEGEFIPPGNPYIEVRNARGTISGINIVLNAKIADDLKPTTEAQSPSTRQNHRQLLSRVVRELRDWSFDEETPPEIRILCRGRRSEPEQFRAEISLQARDIEKNQHTIESLEATAELHANLLSVDSLEAKNSNRELSAQLDYSLEHKTGRFSLDSTLEIPQLLQSWLEIQPIGNLLIAGNQNLEAAGEFKLRKGEPLSLHSTGRASCESAMLRGVRFDSMSSSFAWKDGDLFFKDIELLRPDGKVTGKALIQDSLVRLHLNSTLEPRFYRPLFLGKAMEEVIARFESGTNSHMELDLEGGFDPADPRSWAYSGRASMRNISYRGIPLAELDTSLSLSSAQMDFTDGTIVFDYSDYPMANQFAGPDRGTANFKSVRYVREGGAKVTFADLEGSFWPAPLCRLFLSKTADHLEKYRFHRPPAITGSGLIDLGDKTATRINLAFSSDHLAEYKFLGAPVPMNNPKGKVLVTNDGVRIDDLEVMAFGGPIRTDLNFPKNKPMSAEVEFSKLSMNGINSCYGLNMDSGGSLTGDIRFSMKPGQIATMQGEGDLTLEKSELFSVPIFGPLSHVMKFVLNDDRVGSERAKEARCSFLITDGVVTTKDFRTTTTSLLFAGQGQVDLNNKTIDMTMRVNARGLLGLITLPFRPLYGLFQFRGTGPLNKPDWQREAFTKPDDKEHELLLEDAKAN